MSCSHFAVFRGADGRSLTRALVLVLIASGWIGSVSAGSMAGLAISATTICRAVVGGAPGGGSVPAIPSD